MSWDMKRVVALFTLCIIGPAAMSQPSFWTLVVTGLHFALLIAFYFTAKRVGAREERERSVGKPPRATAA